MTHVAKQPAGRLFDELGATLTLGNDRLFAVILLVAVAPFWIGPYLPLVDLPQHAGQIALLHRMWSGDDAANELFRVNWFTPYLLGYLLLYLFALFLPITAATQLLVSLAVVAVPILTGRLLREAGADERLKWLAIPCSFGFAFYWGFLSFLVAIPFGLAFIALGIRAARAPSTARDLGIAAFGIFLFFCHIIVLGFASLVALGYVLGTHCREPRALVRRTLPYLAPVPVIAVWLVVTYVTESRVQNSPVTFGPLLYRLMELLSQPAGREYLLSAPITVLTVSASVLLFPWLSGATFSHRPERWLPFALGLCAFLLCPHYVLNSAYFYQRLGVFLPPLWLMAWDAPQRPRRVDWLAMAVVAFWCTTSVGRFAAFARETQSFDAIAAKMEPGRRVAAMIRENGSPLFALPVYLHFAVWYQATRGGIVDFNFAEFYSQMARYREPPGGRISEQLAWYPTTFRWAADGGDRYDYFVVKSSIDVSNDIFKDRRDAVELVARDGWWWLYRNLESRAGNELDLARHPRD
jgi:hypothetical protein